MKKELKKVICFFTDSQTFEELHQHSDNRDISLSQLLRSLVRKFLASEGSRKSEHEPGFKPGKLTTLQLFKSLKIQQIQIERDKQYEG